MDITTQIIELTVNESEFGMRLDKFLTLHLKDISRTQIQNLIANGMIANQNGIIYDRSYKIKAGLYKITIVKSPTNFIKPKNIKLDIVFEDNDLIVINKQAGLTTHPGAGNTENTLVNALVNHFDHLSSIAGSDRPGIVHRLDKDTSGLIVVAKNDYTHQALAQQLKERRLTRIYHALCWSKPQLTIGKIDTLIRRNNSNRLKMEVSDISGKRAITDYKIIAKFQSDKLSLIECKLHTGRTHQIRVHMCHIGCPLVGDQVYAKSFKNKYYSLEEKLHAYFANFNRQALIAKKIVFIHPITNLEHSYEIDYPEDLKNLLDVINLC